MQWHKNLLLVPNEVRSDEGVNLFKSSVSLLLNENKKRHILPSQEQEKVLVIAWLKGNDWHFYGYFGESQTKGNSICEPTRMEEESSYHQLTGLGLEGTEH